MTASIFVHRTGWNHSETIGSLKMLTAEKIGQRGKGGAAQNEINNWWATVLSQTFIGEKNDG